MRKIILTAAAILVASQASAGSFYNGNGLHSLCQSNRDVARFYVIGLIDAVNDFATVNGFKPYLCLPDKVTAEQVTDVTCKYFEDHPERRHYTAGGSTMKALREAFPCSG